MDQLLGQLRARRRLVGLIWLTIVVAGGLWVVTLPNIYRSEGKLLVRLGRENVTVDPTANLGQGPLSMVPQSRETELNSVLETLKSRVLIEKLVDAVTPAAVLGRDRGMLENLRDAVLPSSDEPRARAIAKLTKMIEVSALRKSNLIAVICDAPSPELAQSVNQRFIEFFLEHHRTVNRYPGARQFFAQQAELVNAQLRQTDEALIRIKSQTGVAAVDEQQRLLLDRQHELEKQLQSAVTSRLATVAEIATLEAQQRRLPQRIKLEETVGHPNMASDNIRDDLYALELLESKLSAELTEDHFRLKQVREQLAGAKRIYDQEHGQRTQIREGLSSAYQQAELAVLSKQAELEMFKAREAALRPQLEVVCQQLVALNQTAVEITRLERERELQQASYAKYAQSLEQTRIDEALDAERISNIGIVQPPTTDTAPIKPDRPLLVAVVVIFATCAALATGFAASAGVPVDASRPLSMNDPASIDSELLSATEQSPAVASAGTKFVRPDQPR